MSERQCAEEAARVIRDAGGEVTFDEYDRMVADPVQSPYGTWRRSLYHFFAPLHWEAGWGHPVPHRRNIAVLSVIEAVKLGLVERTGGGYRVKPCDVDTEARIERIMRRTPLEPNSR